MLLSAVLYRATPCFAFSVNPPLSEAVTNVQLRTDGSVFLVVYGGDIIGSIKRSQADDQAVNF
jgi:hypothetical protein